MTFTPKISAVTYEQAVVQLPDEDKKVEVFMVGHKTPHVASRSGHNWCIATLVADGFDVIQYQVKSGDFWRYLKN